MAFAPQLDEVNTVTQKKILPALVDNYFRSGPVVAMLKSRYKRGWTGPQIQTNFLYTAPKTSAYRPGGTFDLVRKQTKTGLLFTPRYYATNVSEYLEQIEVELAGEMAMFSTIQQDLNEAALSMSATLEIAAFHNGQNVGGADRTAEINGLEEAFTNGTDATWTGNVFPSYGGQARSGVGTALNSPTGVISSPSVAQTSFNVFHQSYLSACIGKEHPQLCVTTKREMGFIANTFFPHQLIDTKNPEIDWPGFKLNQCTIVMSDYCPGQDGVDDPNIGNYNAAGETAWFLNFGEAGPDKSYITLHIATSPKFAFGFTGFKGARGDNLVAGQLLFAGNLTVQANRLQRALYGFTR